MSVVCISREYGALAEEASVELAKEMGAELVTKELVFADLEAAGIGSVVMEKYDEKKPGFFASLSEQRDAYLHYLKTALFARAVKGPCVIVGRGSVPLFAKVPSAFMVRFIAPLELRIERIAAHFSCDPRRARQLIDQHDNDRRGFNRYFFGADWDDPGLYDLTVNTGKIPLTDCAALIKAALAMVMGSERERAGKAALEGAVLSQAVTTKVLYEAKLQVHFLEASCRDGECRLTGIASSQATIDRCVEVAAALPGVAKVRCEIQLVREYAVLP